jgi:hypothetical protein
MNIFATIAISVTSSARRNSNNNIKTKYMFSIPILEKEKQGVNRETTSDLVSDI